MTTTMGSAAAQRHESLPPSELDAALTASPKIYGPLSKKNHKSPLVFVAALSRNMPVGGPCDYCSKMGASKWCGGCGMALYCDAECQKKHYPSHKKMHVSE